MIGIPSVLGRMVLRRRPADDRTSDELIEVWMSPSRPPWGYVSEADAGPWRLARCSTNGKHIYSFDTYDTFEAAIVDFAFLNRPRPDEFCGIVDGRDQMIVGWSDQADDFPGDHEWDRYRWFGCRFVFEVLAALYPNDPDWMVNVADWERRAAKWSEG